MRDQPGHIYYFELSDETNGRKIGDRGSSVRVRVDWLIAVCHSNFGVTLIRSRVSAGTYTGEDTQYRVNVQLLLLHSSSPEHFRADVTILVIANCFFSGCGWDGVRTLQPPLSLTQSARRFFCVTSLIQTMLVYDVTDTDYACL